MTNNTTFPNATMNYKISEIEGIGAEFARKLEEVEIRSTNDLFVKAATPELRSHLSSRTGIGDGLLTRWFQMADLMRLSGIGSQYSELLVSAGVPSLEKLRTYQPAAVVDMLVKVNTEKKLAKATPTLADVEKWFVSLKDVPVVTPKH